MWRRPTFERFQVELLGHFKYQTANQLRGCSAAMNHEAPTTLHWAYQAQSEPPDIAIFHSAEWHAHKGGVGRLRTLTLTEGDTTIAQLSLRELHIPGLFKRWVLQGEPHADGVPPDHEAALRSLHRFAVAERVDLLSCTFNMARWAEDATRAVCPDGTVESFGTYLMDLSVGLEGIEAGMRSNYRRSLKKARSATPRFTDAVGTQEFTELLASSYSHTGRSLPFGHAYFDELLRRPQVPTICVGIYGDDDRLEAAGVVVYDSSRGYYLHGAARRDGLHGAAILLQCELMRHLIDRGVSTYDLGGARLETTDKRLAGIAAFKRRFGGRYEAVGRFEWAISSRGRFFTNVLKKNLNRVEARLKPSR